MKFIFLCGLQFASALYVYTPCYVPDKCKCTAGAAEGVTLKCQNLTSSDVARIPFDNVTSIMIKSSNIDDPTVLRNIRVKNKIDRSKNITFMNSKLDHFSWEWMPETIQRLQLANTGITDIYSKKIVNSEGQIEYQCSMDHIKDMRGFHISGVVAFTTIPVCLPRNLRQISLRGVDLSNLGNDTHDNEIKWPESLKTLQFANNNIKTLSRGIFANASQNLTWLVLRDQPISESSILLKLPAHSLQYLRFQNLSITRFYEDHFRSFRQHKILHTLVISFSNLAHVPKGMPSSIRTLCLNNNRIKHLDVTAFAHMTNLEYLDMRRNFLQTVPEGLPVTLRHILFDHNEIATSDSEAFSKMRTLRSLILAHNRLTSMPQNIPTEVSHYSIAGNDISDIGSHSHYDFCHNCAMFDIEDNPWACNTNMMEFLVWTNKHRNRTHIAMDPDQVHCAGGLPGLNDMLLQGIINYIQCYTKLGCDYDVRTLNCTANGIKSVPKLTRVIHHIHIADNPLIKKVPDDTFSPLDSLTLLELRNIGLTRIPKGLPKAILRLSLANNRLTEISDGDAEALKNLTNVRTIDLRYNLLTTMPLVCTRPLDNLNLVILQGNPLDCNCDLWPYTHWSNKIKTANSEVGMYEDGGLRGTCASPDSLNGTDVTELYEHFKNKSCLPSSCYWDTETPIINCSFAKQLESAEGKPATRHNVPDIPSNGYWRTIDLSGLKLKTSEVNLSHLRELTSVILKNNSLNTVPLKGLPGSVTTLIVSHNNISILPAPGLLRKTFERLKTLDLRFNNIRNLNEEDVSLFRHLETMKIHGNPLVCDCNLRPLTAWISATHDNPKMANHGIETLTCSGPPPLAGEIIADLDEEQFCPPIPIGAVIGGTIGGLTIVITIVILIIIYWNKKYKIREREAILRGFKEVLQHEAGFIDVDPETGVGDDTRFRYDAFLSYSQDYEDEEFATMLLDGCSGARDWVPLLVRLIMEYIWCKDFYSRSRMPFLTLTPFSRFLRHAGGTKLEITHGYKLCVHERDFAPGVGIADNIVECIGASKRIILILSQNFVSTPWCQYEVQVALTELHQKRKSKLLIPILLEDLEGQVEGSVKTFLSLIKGIKIPSTKNHSSWEQFWSEILKAMPEPLTAEEVV